MILQDQQNTVEFPGVVQFDTIQFQQITGSYLYIGTSSQLMGTTSVQLLQGSSQGQGLIIQDGIIRLCTGSTSASIYIDQLGGLNFDTNTQQAFQLIDGILILGDSTTASLVYSGGNFIQTDRGIMFGQDQTLSFTTSLGTASIWYDGTQMHIDGFTSGGNSWKTEYKLTGSLVADTPYTIFTESDSQTIQHYPYLAVFLNGDMLIQSSSTTQYQHWDYKDGGNSSSIQFRYNIPYSAQDQFYLAYVYNGGSV